MTCRICENAGGNKTFTVPEMMFGCGDEFLYFQCARCGCLQIAEFSADLSKYYPPNYYSFAEPAPRQSAPPDLQKIRDQHAIFGKGILGRMLHAGFPNAHMRGSLLSELPGLKKSARILDIGSGSGALLYTLQENGFIKLPGTPNKRKTFLIFI